MTIKTLAVLLFFYFLSCSEKVPQHIINEDKFSILLADIYYLNSTLEILPIRYKDSIINLERSKLLIKHEINDSLFSKSMKYYNAHPKIMEKIEAKIREELIKRISKDSSDAGYIPQDTVPKFN